MRSYKSPAEFFRKMKKKPALQVVIDHIHNYSDEDIDNLQGSHFPLWIKAQLHLLKVSNQEFKNRGNKTAEEVANELAEKMIAASLLNKE